MTLTPCANLSLLFTEHPPMERFAAAAEAEFRAVEVLFPYSLDRSAVKEELTRHGLDLVLINCPFDMRAETAPAWAADPNGVARFRDVFLEVADWAEDLGARFIHMMSGPFTEAAARETYVENLRWAADTRINCQLTIEPINRVSLPDYLVADFDDAARMIAEVDRPNVSLQFDTFHAAMIEGDVTTCWSRVGHLVRHVQVGSHPTRAEPDDHSHFFNLLRESGYEGAVSGEYNPAGKTADGLRWVEMLG